MAGKHHLIGLKEMAPLFGIQPHTTAMWRYRGVLPEPDYEISGSPIWELDTLVRWGRETGRPTYGHGDSRPPAERRKLVGLKEMGPLFGVRSATADMWRYRNQLVAPDYEISGCPVWELRTLVRWGRETGRPVVGASETPDAHDPHRQPPTDDEPTTTSGDGANAATRRATGDRSAS